MAPKKLTEADKQTILGLYYQPGQTTSTLAERYGVSNSTISRLLKSNLPEAVYSALIQQKRGSVERQPPIPDAVAVLPPPPSVRTVAAPVLKKRTLESTSETQVPESDLLSDPLVFGAGGASIQEDVAPISTTLSPDLTVEGDLPESWDEDSVTLDDDYADDEDYDEEDGDEEARDWEESALSPPLEALEIYPLTAKALPSLCYLVVERVSSELVALPLRTFANLGQIPELEGDSRTLPVFDNHHIARRFSRRNQRVIKVPDGTLLQTTLPYLKAKGITRLLIDGQVFTLEEP
ncbi:MAG: hypothetical protein LVS60_19670 [Nodosilinea sp. LVE1205-7]|jgi:transposase-like protein